MSTCVHTQYIDTKMPASTDVNNGLSVVDL